jgi:hypothetical protein
VKKVFFFLWLIPLYVNGQDSSGCFTYTLSAELVSKYMWRGVELSNAPNIQPTATLNYKDFYFGFWGSSPLQAGGSHEADLVLGWQGKYWGFCLTDYFVMDHSIERNYYFDWSENKTNHDLSLDITFPGTDKIPFRALAAFNFYGLDKQHSRYYEVAWMFTKDEFEGEIFAGGTDHEGWYGSYEGVVNTGIMLKKSIKITDKYRLPLFTRLIVNPQKENVYLVLGLKFE